MGKGKDQGGGENTLDAREDSVNRLEANGTARILGRDLTVGDYVEIELTDEAKERGMTGDGMVKGYVMGVTKHTGIRMYYGQGKIDFSNVPETYYRIDIASSKENEPRGGGGPTLDKRSIKAIVKHVPAKR